MAAKLRTQNTVSVNFDVFAQRLLFWIFPRAVDFPNSADLQLKTNQGSITKTGSTKLTRYRMERISFSATS